MNLKNFFKILGPGLIYAGAAVGVSHLVQSTRAGASYGYDLIWILLLANIIKYPFFEFAPRYVSATGNSLISGYQKLGKWAIVSYASLTLLTMFAIQAAVTIVTAGLVASAFKLTIDPVTISAIILGVTTIILIIGKYSILDKLMKLIIVVLAVSTIFAVISAFGQSHSVQSTSASFDWMNRLDIFFLIAFIGWMPSPIDVSVWSSVWSVAKYKQLGFKPSLKQSLLDFKIGYIGTTILALGFLLLGARILYGSGEELSSNGVVFSEQLINMYTVSIGSWAKIIISIAALTTMFSTTLTCLDAYPRVLQPTTEILFPKANFAKLNSGLISLLWIIILVIGTLLLLGYFAGSMRFMVDLATTLSFVTAPILAYMNYRVVTDKHMPVSFRPGIKLRWFAWIGIIFLSLFTIGFLYWRFLA
ncbi:MAG: hypothetical protein CVU00_03970 [Bacteroidetes bacterium HGW-Bacteroidetes-17]|jgi:Mn2+/Fe2+ NRAMP family transporter|nr:MAG: hypothetical protein CVU00_03970 [Bacteroidetes bacterium HGW-Bacteroidetes-17]